MPQLVVHVRKDGAERPEPAYAVWVSDTGASVRAFGPDWEAAVPWACLTGSMQIAHCWLILYEITSDARYRDAAFAAKLKSWLPTRGHRVLAAEAMELRSLPR